MLAWRATQPVFKVGAEIYRSNVASMPIRLRARHWEHAARTTVMSAFAMYVVILFFLALAARGAPIKVRSI